MKHHVAAPPPANVVESLREDAALRALYRADSLAAIDGIWAGLTNAQKDALLKGMAKVVWLLLRRLA